MLLPPLPNFEEFGPVQRDPLTRVRKLTAQKMSLSWSLIPHVTQHDLADVTDLEAFRKQQEARGLKLTVTAFALKACAWCGRALGRRVLALRSHWCSG
jgi:pyruvate dehydrogenase E2 component (dihydrolipoamide acetyltransferase)